MLQAQICQARYDKQMTLPESSPKYANTAALPAERLGRRHGSLSKVVADELRRSILTGRRKAGDRLVEDRLSTELGVSRVPIREALRLLAAEGLPPGKDTMPLDEGVKSELPDKKIR